MDQDSGSRAELYEQLARIGKVVVHPKRIELFDLLCQGERSVEALAAATGLTLTAASAHLQVMRQARLVETRREGTRVCYRGAGAEVGPFVGALGGLARARLAEVDQILCSLGTDAAGTERVSREELVARVPAGEVVVLDVRPEEEYASGRRQAGLPVEDGLGTHRGATRGPRRGRSPGGRGASPATRRRP